MFWLGMGQNEVMTARYLGGEISRFHSIIITALECNLQYMEVSLLKKKRKKKHLENTDFKQNMMEK